MGCLMDPNRDDFEFIFVRTEEQSVENVREGT